METVKCSKCKLIKEKKDFHLNKSSKTGYSQYCKICKKEYDSQYRQGDKIQNLYKSKTYRDRRKEYSKKRRSESNEKTMLLSAKARAKKMGLPFNLIESDIIIPEFCPLLGIKLERKEQSDKSGFIYSSPSLDRIIPELGYVKGNIMVISMKANSMKYNASIEELIKFSHNILKLFKNE